MKYWMLQNRNKESDPEKYALKLKVHQEGVRHCQYSTNGTKVLSCASLEVKVRSLTCTCMNVSITCTGRGRGIVDLHVHAMHTITS